MATPILLEREFPIPSHEKVQPSLLPDHEMGDLLQGRLKLWRVVARLGALPFTPESVAAYEECKEQEANARESLMREVLKNKATTWKHLAYASMGAIALPLLPLFAGITVAPSILMLYAMIIPAIIAGLCIMKRQGFQDTVRWTRSWEWQTVPMQRYARIAKVPPDVVALAEAIVKEMPDTQPFVRVLSKENLLGDPFLVIRHDGKDHFVAVWDEESFSP